MDNTLKMFRFSIRPLYLQVHDTLVERIKSGMWQPGSPLPNEIELSQELGVSVGTVRKALEEMEEKHIVVRRQGRGTFVADATSSEIALRFTHIRDETGQRIAGIIDRQEAEIVAADADEGARLEIPHNAKVLRVKRLRSHRNRVFMVERASLPMSLFADMPDAKAIRLEELAQSNCILLTRATERVGAMKANAEDAALLGVEIGAPLLQLDRVIFTVDGRPAEWRVATCNLVEEQYAVLV